MAIGARLRVARLYARLIFNVVKIEFQRGTFLKTLAKSVKGRRVVFGDDIPFGAMVDEKAKKNKDRVFLIYGERRITYRQLKQDSDRVAAGLAAIGAQPGDGVGLLMTNSPEYLFAFYGAQKIGCYCVPINIGLKSDGFHYIAHHSRIRYLFVDAALTPLVESVAAQLPELRKQVVFDEAGASSEPFGERVNLRSWLETDAAGTDIAREFPPDGISYLMYTSGTTGRPKGVVYRHSGTGVKQMFAVARTLFHRDDVFYTPLPLFHANALTVTTLMAFGADARVVLGKRFSAGGFWKDVREHQVTTFNTIGAMIPILLKQTPCELDSKNNVRLVLSAACPAHLWEPFEKRYGVRLFEVYGAVDGGGFGCFNLGDAPAGSIGKPFSGKYRLVDANGNDAPPGQPGELVFWVGKNKSRSVEYFNNEEASEEKEHDGWLHTGDLVSADRDGFLYFVGRLTESMRRRGENVSAYDVETQVARYEDVLECAAYGVPSELGEDEIMITVAPVEGREIDIERFYSFLGANLPKFALPRYIRVVPEIPKTATHRVIKKQLQLEGITRDTLDMEGGGRAYPSPH